ncbi:hypothetical protein C8R46DRAFT_1040469 [Mycena filopes]|nr:hypothetical protein C8R46DRAFT_1040469 [Mycena filopes]
MPSGIRKTTEQVIWTLWEPVCTHVIYGDQHIEKDLKRRSNLGRYWGRNRKNDPYIQAAVKILNDTAERSDRPPQTQIREAWDKQFPGFLVAKWETSPDGSVLRSTNLQFAHHYLSAVLLEAWQICDTVTNASKLENDFCRVLANVKGLAAVHDFDELKQDQLQRVQQMLTIIQANDVQPARVEALRQSYFPAGNPRRTPEEVGQEARSKAAQLIEAEIERRTITAEAGAIVNGWVNAHREFTDENTREQAVIQIQIQASQFVRDNDVNEEYDAIWHACWVMELLVIGPAESRVLREGADTDEVLFAWANGYPSFPDQTAPF